MVERFHRQLKSSIKAHHDPTKWTEILPLVILSIHRTVKDDLQCAPAQLVYGTTLRLLGQFITPNSSPALDPTIYVDRLQHAMQDLKPAQPRLQAIKTYLPKDLSTCTHVYVRTDAVRTPLQPPYPGPYPIIQRNDKHFTLDIVVVVKKTSVSIA